MVTSAEALGAAARGIAEGHRLGITQAPLPLPDVSRVSGAGGRSLAGCPTCGEDGQC